MAKARCSGCREVMDIVERCPHKGPAIRYLVFPHHFREWPLTNSRRSRRRCYMGGMKAEGVDILNERKD